MNKKQAYIVGGIIVVLLVAWAIYASRNNSTNQNADQQNNEQSNNSTATTVPTATTQTPGKLSYTDAVKKYTNRFQFFKCSGTPGLISVKKGTPVMLDNRDATAHTIKANGQTVRIAGYDYAVIYPTLTTKDSTDLTLSNITCDGGGAATLNVEK